MYTTDRDTALQYIVKDTRPTHFIKNEAYKKHLEKNPPVIRMFYFKEGRYYLPWCTYKTTRFKNVKKLPEEIKSKMTGDYSYQLEALKATYNCTTKWIMLRSGEWTGKSLLISALYHMYEDYNPTIVVPTQNIQLQLEQLLPKALVVCMPTLTNKYDVLNDGSMLLIDECFVAWTKVDWKNIEDIQVWDYVRSFNHNTNKVEYKKVLHKFKSKPTSLCKLTTWSKTIVCTPDHPFRNWLDYTTQKDKDMMLYIISTNNENISRHLYWMLNRVWIYTVSKTRSLQNYMKTLLFSWMLKKICMKNIFWSCRKDQQEIRISKDEEKKSYAQSCIKSENENNTKNNVTQATSTMRQLKTNANTPKNAIISFMMGCRTTCLYWIKKCWLISTLLQDRYSQWNINDLNRGRWIKSFYNNKTDARQKETGVFRTERMDNIEVPKQTSDGEFGWMCPGGYVYNIEVEDNNNYFVEDVLVHNCHHLSELKRWEIQMRRWPIVWLTATPIRKDFGPEGFEMIFGTLHDTGAESLPVKVYFDKCETKYTAEEAYELTKHLAPDSTQKRRELLYSNAHRNKRIVDLSIGAYNKHNKVIVFTDRKTHLEIIVSMLEESWCQHIVTLHWGTKKKKFYEDIAKMDKYIIVCTIQCAWEWLNLPDLMVWVCAFNTTDYKTTRQMVWRVRRKSDGKTHWYMIDFRDTIQIGESRKRYMWSGQRKKHYLSLWFIIISLTHDKKD